MERLVLLFRISALIIGVAILAEAQASYDILNRYKVLEDKFRTHDSLTPLEHAFIFDFNALLNTNAFSFYDEAKKASETAGDTQAKITAAQGFLAKYNKSEQNLRVGLGIGIPIFSFNLFGIEFKPNLRVQANLGALMGIQTSNLTTAQIIANAADYLGTGVPTFLITALQSCNTSGLGLGDDVVLYIINNCGLTPTQQTNAQALVGKYFLPGNTTTPDIYNYLKGEARAGLYFDYKYDDHFFGSFSLYGLGRADIRSRITADSIARDADIIDLGEEMNTTVNAAIDYKLGYKNGNLMGYVGIEDVKVAGISDNVDKGGGKLIYGTDPLYRMHGEYIYKFLLFSVKPFAGFHYRDGYDFVDGIYGGADVGLHGWGERIGLRFRGMADNEHITFSPMAKLWLVHIEYMLKQPIKGDIDNVVEPATIHSLNFRLSI